MHRLFPRIGTFQAHFTFNSGLVPPTDVNVAGNKKYLARMMEGHGELSSRGDLHGCFSMKNAGGAAFRLTKLYSKVPCALSRFVAVARLKIEAAKSSRAPHDRPAAAADGGESRYAKLPLPARRFLIVVLPGARRWRSALYRQKASSMLM